MNVPGLVVDVLLSDEVSAQELAALRELAWAAFSAAGDDLHETDWEHALGGHHAIARLDSRPVGHAAVVPRTLLVDGEPVAAGYVEAVATAVEVQGLGIGSAVMSRIGEVVTERFALGALSTYRPSFYARLGWLRWRGPSYVVAGARWRRTADEDDGIMVLPGRLAGVDLTASIACRERSGDCW